MSSTMGNNRGSPEEDRKLVEITEHPRHKRRRRGKKRKLNRADRSANEGDSENNAAYDMSDADENEALEKDANNAKRRPKGVLIRPINVPKAPENSTQFIMEDHTMDDHNDSHLYVSFETPDPYFKDFSEAEDSRSQDINFMYESMKSLDDSFCTRDFEAAYTTSRYDYYMQLSKQELVTIIEKLHLGHKEVEEDLLNYDPSSVLEQLQQKLLCLQEENTVLKQTNASLKTVYRIESNESVSEQSLEELSGNEDMTCITRLTATYCGGIESDIDSSVDGNYPEHKKTLEHTGHGEAIDVNNVNSETLSENLLVHSSGNELDRCVDSVSSELAVDINCGSEGWKTLSIDNITGELKNEEKPDHPSCEKEGCESSYVSITSGPAGVNLLDHTDANDKDEHVLGEVSNVEVKELVDT